MASALQSISALDLHGCLPYHNGTGIDVGILMQNNSNSRYISNQSRLK